MWGCGLLPDLERLRCHRNAILLVQPGICMRNSAPAPPAAPDCRYFAGTFALHSPPGKLLLTICVGDSDRGSATEFPFPPFVGKGSLGGIGGSILLSLSAFAKTENCPSTPPVKKAPVKTPAKPATPHTASIPISAEQSTGTEAAQESAPASPKTGVNNGKVKSH